MAVVRIDRAQRWKGIPVRGGAGVGSVARKVPCGREVCQCGPEDWGC